MMKLESDAEGQREKAGKMIGRSAIMMMMIMIMMIMMRGEKDWTKMTIQILKSTSNGQFRTLKDSA